MKTDLIINMKERKERLNETYQKLLEVGFGNGPLDESFNYIDENVMGYGTALDEKIMSYNDFRDLIIVQRKQAANFDDFIYQSNPVINRLFNEGNSALIVDEIDLTSVINGDNNKMTVRMSTMLEFNKESWKIVHWHGSIAEHVSDGEDPWHVNEWKQKTAELQKLVDQKTVDLLNKNRELEIEASLERVRAVAMGMSKSEDLLDICEVSYNEFEKLGFENLRAVLIHILDDESRTFTDYDYCELFGGEISTLSYDSHPVVVNYFKQIKSRKDAFAEAILSGEELESWKKVRLETGQKNDPRLNDTDALYYYGYSIGFGDFSISTLKPIDETQIRILKRFRNVFDLAYRRFIDIEKAEAQARESQIEAALERVRTRAMAMQKSDELRDAASLLYKELRSLRFEKFVNCGYVLIDEKNNIQNAWMTNADGTIRDVHQMPLTGDEIMDERYEMWKKKVSIFHQTVGGERLREHNAFVTGQSLTKAESDNMLIDLPDPTVFYFGNFSEGYLHILAEEQFSRESEKLLARFTSVFEITFRRFLDLQKAEAQAREAKVDAALERVRSRSMGMQKSEELKEVIQVIYDQFVHLDVNVEHTGFIIDYKDRDDMLIWLADKNGAPSKIVIPYFDSPHWNSFIAAKNNGSDFFANQLNFEEKNKFYRKLFTFIPDLPEEARDFYYSCPGLAISTVLADNVGLYMENFSGSPYSDEENKILMRFGKVLQQTYTRFLDLQKAEKQAREAQIEAALERVRSLALGMRKSEEVGNVTDRLFKELINLSVDVNGASIVVIDEDTDKMELWRARSNIAVKPFESTSFSESMNLLNKYMPDWFPTFFDALRKRKSYLIDELTGDKRSQFINAIAEQYKYSDEERSQLLKNTPERITTYYIFFKLGYLALLGENKLSEENLSIARRFVEVFEFSYTRFLDIQKAEAQTREAQIEAALERVRSRSMAMHKSDELADLSLELVKQVHALGVDIWFCAFNIYDDDQQGSLEWGSNGQGTFPQYRTPREGIFLRYYEAGQRGKKLFVNEINEKECPAHYDYLCSLPGVGEQLLKMKNAGIPFPTSQIDHVAYFKYGYIIFITFEPALEAHDIFKRFAGVFEQTYTRFLDLQKSEEQRKIIQAENDRKTEELEEARQLQLAMLPKELPKLSKLDIAVYMQTATEVGGDYYDFSTKDDGSLNVCLGDATGHGLKAGTLVAMMKSLFTNDSVKLDINKFFNSSNETLKKMSLNNMMMAFAMINIYGDKISIANAGIPPVFIYRKENNEIEEIDLHGLPIGAMKNFKYVVYDSKVESGDVILMMSDGMPELQNKENEMYGYDRLKKVFKENAERNSNDIITVFKRESITWSGNKEPEDDITFVVIKIK